VLQVPQGSLYPALERFKREGWIRAKTGESDTGRPAKFHRLTTTGRKRLELETEDWHRLSSAINQIVQNE
jgi:PadR family transcriptional regulator, regulatory protein PadR